MSVEEYTNSDNIISCEQNWINSLDPEYNINPSAGNSKGYKHTDEAKEKMVKRFEDKINHPFWGKHHNEKSKSLISKPGELNPMFNKRHSISTKQRIALSKSKTPLGLYDINNKIKLFYLYYFLCKCFWI